MTVSELIEKLQAFDNQNMEVVVDAEMQCRSIADVYEGAPEIGAIYVIIDGGEPIPRGMDPNDPQP